MFSPGQQIKGGSELCFRSDILYSFIAISRQCSEVAMYYLALYTFRSCTRQLSGQLCYRSCSGGGCDGSGSGAAHSSGCDHHHLPSTEIQEKRGNIHYPSVSTLSYVVD